MIIVRNTRIALAVLASALLAPGAHAQAAAPMVGMDMGGMKMPQKPLAASLSVTATINPAAPRSGDNTLDLLVRDAAGEPVTGLKLTGSVAMTSMDMGTTHPAFTEAGGGHYKATVTFSMEGPWRVTVRTGSSQLAVLNFKPGTKTPWKSPQISAAAAPSGAAPIPPRAAAVPAAKVPAQDAMAGMNMGGTSNAKSSSDAKNNSGSTAGMNMDGGGISAMKTGIADMKTATIPQLQEKGTYTATGDENWKAQTGFGHNAGMVGMMNQMMVGGSGMEGMKMPAMTMKFDAQNYANPNADDADNSMKDQSGAMAGMKMDAAPVAAKQNSPTVEKGLAGMDMAAPPTGNASAASAPLKIMAVTAGTPKAGDNALIISLTDAQGKPVTGAAISTSVAMTSMDMGTSHPAVTEKGGGQYATTATFSMAGPWRVKVKVALPGQKPQTKAFDFTAK